MLWTDALFITSSDLQTVDGEILDVATSEQIVLDGVNGLIWRSVEDSGRFLMKRLVNFAGFLTGDSLSANHLQAVYNIGTPAVQRTRLLFDNVVVTGANANVWSELKSWCVQKSLEATYRAAANRRNEDRYEKKRDAYAHEARWKYWQQFQIMGLPTVYKPMQAPAAVMAHSPGSFIVSTVAGAGTQSGEYDVAITYFDNTVTSIPPNAESNPSAITTLALTSGNVVSVNISGLNPPNGMGNPIDVARAIITPLNATTWNIYAGVTGGPLFLQNAVPIPITVKTYALPGNILLSGQICGLGQYPNQYLTITETLQRG